MINLKLIEGAAPKPRRSFFSLRGRTAQEPKTFAPLHATASGASNPSVVMRRTIKLPEELETKAALVAKVRMFGLVRCLKGRSTTAVSRTIDSGAAPRSSIYTRGDRRGRGQA